MFIDQSSVGKGSLLTDVIPPVNPLKEIDDPNDSKPSDWDERAKIPDPEAVKPDDWWGYIVCSCCRRKEPVFVY